MRIFRNKSFTRFARKEDLDDATLRKTIDDAERGIDRRQARRRRDKTARRPARERKVGRLPHIILYRPRALAFFVHAFAKKDRDNIGADELAALRLLASQMLSYNDQEIAKAVESGTLIEVTRHEKDKTVS